MKKIILYIVTEDWYFLSHRLALALKAKESGYQVNVLCKDTGMSKDIINYGFTCYELKSNTQYVFSFTPGSYEEEVRFKLTNNNTG